MIQYENNAAPTVYEGAEAVRKALNSLYASYGYNRYKMSKFEEYDLYVRNKDFLASERIITFTDTNGKLMALKPDVTLSIVKNCLKTDSTMNKVYYDENVYRVNRGIEGFRELRQTGLECIGELGIYEITEVLELAAKSLRLVSESAVLEISHLGIISDILGGIALEEDDREKALQAMSSKNMHELGAVLTAAGAAEADIEFLKTIILASGDAGEILAYLEAQGSGKIREKAIFELQSIVAQLEAEGLGGMVKLDFSAVGNLNYYNGIVFTGYIEGIPQSVLSGGEYSRLVRKLGTDRRAIGFALYVDRLEMLFRRDRGFDADVLILMDTAEVNAGGTGDCPSDQAAEASETAELYRMVREAAKEMRGNGKSVLVAPAVPEDKSFGKIYKAVKGGLEEIEKDA